MPAKHRVAVALCLSVRLSVRLSQAGVLSKTAALATRVTKPTPYDGLGTSFSEAKDLVLTKFEWSHNRLTPRSISETVQHTDIVAVKG